ERLKEERKKMDEKKKKGGKGAVRAPAEGVDEAHGDVHPSRLKRMGLS
ncbi:MAG: hypothetical protein INR71_06555, partial [Terriglobus roseus]|nr:hypothetical protein [Terriglobus roseus]